MGQEGNISKEIANKVALSLGYTGVGLYKGKRIKTGCEIDVNNTRKYEKQDSSYLGLGLAFSVIEESQVRKERKASDRFPLM